MIGSRRYLWTLVLTLALLHTACGDDPPCEKSGEPCSTAEMPQLENRNARATANWLGQAGQTFWAYGEGNVAWSTDGHSVSLHAAAPTFNPDGTPRRVTLDIELFTDVDADPPGCFVGEGIFPLCFVLGASGGGNATLEDGTAYYVTEGQTGIGRVELLGFGESGELVGSFELTTVRKEGETVIPGQAVSFTAGRFSAPRR